MSVHHVELLTRQLKSQPGEPVEIVVAAKIDGHRIELPQGGLVQVTYDAGELPPIVRLDILAADVRHVSEDEACSG